MLQNTGWNQVSSEKKKRAFGQGNYQVLPAKTSHKNAFFSHNHHRQLLELILLLELI
jgi:hypothetical protein